LTVNVNATSLFDPNLPVARQFDSFSLSSLAREVEITGMNMFQSVMVRGHDVIAARHSLAACRERGAWWF
jgi:hypothetical protein